MKTVCVMFNNPNYYINLGQQFVLVSALQEEVVELQLRKILSRENIQVTANHIDTLNSSTQYCSDKTPLNVVLNHDDSVRTRLEEVCTLVACWLLYHCDYKHHSMWF